MPKSSLANEAMPAPAAAALRQLGSDLAVARKRRGEGLRGWSERLGVSVPTLMRLEKGDPTVAMGAYATALWLVNRHSALASAASPKEDLAALESEIRQAENRHRPRGDRSA